MIFKGRSQIKAMIEDQYSSIVELIGIYPNLLEEWRRKECEQCRIIAKEYSEGDGEVENGTYNNLTIGFENLSTVERFFNNSMFLIVFSYFEGIINTIAKKENVEILKNKDEPKYNPKAEEIISKIEEQKNFSLSAEIATNLNEILKLRKIRNHITHNNGVVGTKNERDVNSLIKGIQGVSIYEGNVAIDDLNFILNVHKKIYSILDELSTKLNY